MRPTFIKMLFAYFNIFAVIVVSVSKDSWDQEVSNCLKSQGYV